MKVMAKRTLAVISSAALLLSCGMTGLFTADAASSGIFASGSSEGDATKMYIYDEYGNLLTNVTEDSPIVYIDNSTKANNGSEDFTDTFVTVEIRNEEHELTDSILDPGDSSAVGKNFTQWITDRTTTEHTASYKLHFKGCYYQYVETTDPITGETKTVREEVPYEPGRVSVRLQSLSGKVSDTLVVVVQEPATDINISYGSDALKVNDNSMYNTADGLMVTANHHYKFDGSIVTAHPSVNAEYLDKIEWNVYDGILKGDMGLTTEDLAELPTATLAEITQDGLLTTKSFGQVTIVATLKDTIKAQRDYERKLRAYNRTYPDLTAEGVPAAPVYVSDRLPVQGAKSRNIYMPEIDPESYEVVMEGSDIKYQVDDKGNRVIGTLSMDTKVLRSHYYKDGAGVVYSDPLLYDGKPVYIPNINTPKYVNVYIRRDNPATKIEFTSAPDSMVIGDTYALEIYKTPTHNEHEEGYEAGATDEIVWTSSNPSVATVDEDGIVTAISKGDVEITAIGDNISASHHIVVRAKAKSISISPRTATTRVGVPVELSAILDPVEANEEVVWESEDPSVAIVEAEETSGELTNVQKALVTGVTVGTTNIRAIVPNAKDPTSPIYVNCLVEVKPKNLSSEVILSVPDGSNINYIEDNDVLELFTNSDLTINARLRSEGGETADDKVKWTILANDNFVTIPTETTEKITLHGIAEGTITVIASAEADDTVNKVFRVKVLRRCDSVAVTEYGTKTQVTAKNLNVGGTLELGANMTVQGSRPDAHSDYIKSFTSSDPSVASIEYIYNDIDKVTGCTVTAKKNGTAYITVTTGSGAQSSMSVNVFTTSSVDISGVTLDEETNKLATSMTLDNDLNGSMYLTAVIRDHNNNVIYGSDVVWTSSNEEVATIGNDGLITGKDVGTTELTVTSGGKSESCVLTVYAPITAITPFEIAPITYTPRLTSFVPQSLELRVGKHTLTEGVDFTKEYSNNESIGTAYLTIHGMGYYTGDTYYMYQIVQKNLEDNDIFIQYGTRQECTGLPLSPDVKVFYDGIQLTPSNDYYLTFTDNTYPGTATITIQGNGCYTGSTTKKFEIFCDHKNLVNSTITKRATYEENGVEVGTCAACGEENVHNIIPRFVHSSNPALSLSFEKPEYGLLPGETNQLVPIAVTKDTTTGATDVFRWESDDPLVVSVSDTGVITGMNVGKTTITVYGENENVEASCVVAVLTKVEELSVDPNPIETRVGVSVELKAEIAPVYSNDELVWESGNTSIATVAPSESDPLAAIVTGQAIGRTTITARARYSDVSYVMDINVGERNASDIIAVTTKIGETPVHIPNSTATTEYTHRIYTNQDVTFTAALTNSTGKASDDVVIWRITDNEGDTITLPNNDANSDIIGSELLVHAASLGTVTITAFPQTNPELKTHFKLEVAKRCDTVTIMNEKDEVVTARALNVGDHLNLHAVLTTLDPNHPFDHGDDVRTWESSDPSVVEVDNTGYVTAKKNGAAYVTVITRSGQTSYVSITVFTTSDVYLVGGVEKPAEDGGLPTATLLLDTTLNGSMTITPAIYDQNGTAVYGAYCTWTSTNESVATVDENGLVTPHSVGTSMITAKSGAKTQTCLLTVYAPIAAMETEGLDDIVYTPKIKAYTPEPIIKVGGKTLVKDVDYTLEYQNNETIGTATIIVTGMGLYTDVTYATFVILPRPLDDALVVIAPIADQDYTGNYVTPKIQVTCDGIDLVQDSDFVVTYLDNIEEGKATVTISPAWGSCYADSATTSFNIIKTFFGTMGDVNSDTVIDSNDALKVLRASVGMDSLTPEESILADVSGDGTVTSDDSLLILRYSNGLEAPGAKIDVPAAKGA